MNQYPFWKYSLVSFVLVAGVLYALPNLYGQDPSVQISAAGRVEVTEDTEARVRALLDGAGLAFGALQRAEGRILIRFANEEAQLKAKDVIQEGFQKLNPNGISDYVVALNLAPKTPEWLRAIGAEPMNLGLDLRGGVHFLMEVDTDQVLAVARGRIRDDARALFREDRYFRGAAHRPSSPEEESTSVVFGFKSAEPRDQAHDLIRSRVQGVRLEAVDEDGTYRLRIALSEQQIVEEQQRAITQNITTLRKRVNEIGVAEPAIQQQGPNRIVVELPGVQDTAQAKDILGATATLEFRIVEKTPADARNAAQTGRIPPGTRLYRDRDGDPYLLSSRVIVTGESITQATSGREHDTGQPAVFVTLNGQGGDKMSAATRDKVGRLMAVVFIEQKTVYAKDENGEMVIGKKKVEEVINAATIRSQLGKNFQVTGLDPREANRLALLLSAGSLAAPMDIVEERTIGPSLGEENIDKGMQSVLIGMLLVLLFMAVYYRVFGLVADLALVANLVILVAAMGILGKLGAAVTLTLPGIAGIVLTVGMAVDANVLIFERIREEIRAGNSPQASIFSGYEKAFATIADANITTFIAALILYAIGNGPVQGFAITLAIGIATSMFTAIVGTRAVINLVYGRRRVAKLSI